MAHKPVHPSAINVGRALVPMLRILREEVALSPATHTYLKAAADLLLDPVTLNWAGSMDNKGHTTGLRRAIIDLGKAYGRP